MTLQFIDKVTGGLLHGGKWAQARIQLEFSFFSRKNDVGYQWIFKGHFKGLLNTSNRVFNARMCCTQTCVFSTRNNLQKISSKNSKKLRNFNHGLDFAWEAYKNFNFDSKKFKITILWRKMSQDQLRSAILKSTRTEVHCLDAVFSRECSWRGIIKNFLKIRSLEDY